MDSVNGTVFRVVSVMKCLGINLVFKSICSQAFAERASMDTQQFSRFDAITTGVLDGKLH